MISEIIKTAMLGTERSFPKKENLPEFLHEQYERIVATENTKEDKFLKISALFFQAHQTSSKNLFFTENPISVPQETKPYISPKLATFLKQYLKKNKPIMLLFTLKMIEKVEKIVPPNHVPPLLDMAYSKMEWRNRIDNVCGERRKWLGNFNPRWQNIFDHEKNDEKLAKKSEKNKIDKFTTDFLTKTRVEQLDALEEKNKSDSEFYRYLNLLMTDEFICFSSDFSMKIWAELQNRHCGQNTDFYHKIALHLHSSLKSEILEQTNMGYAHAGIHPNVAREMLEIIMDRDDIIANS